MFVLVGLLLVACGTDLGAADGGSDSGPDSLLGCEANAEPKNSPACVADGFGVFVDATNGKDSNNGTKGSPVQTIAHALDIAKGQSLKRVYICEGTYAEDLALDAAHDAISLYGGWKCSDWSYSGTKAKIGKTQTAAKLDSLKGTVTVEDLEFDSVDGDATTVSSTAMFVNASSNVTLSRLKLVAGKGHDGPTGTLSTFTYPDQATLNGKPAVGSTAGGSNTVTCPGGQKTVGGAGGDGSGQAGGNGSPTLSGGQGGTTSSCGGGGTGKDGTAASAAANAATITTLGTLTATGWASTAGAKGTDGGPGQGGGGGYGSGGGGGGGGGAGGCGGAGGGGGGGGGASIAVAVLSSSVTINGSALLAAGAGNGGAGVAGQAGETLYGFYGGGSPPGCGGGNGGTGGAGGAGAGGAGGLSVGILWTGAQPTADSATTSDITVAAAGGMKGTGGAGNDGLDGVAQPVMQAP